MLKKLACMILAVQGCGVYAGSVIEGFDWGPGVSGRETLTAGAPLNGVRVQSGDAVFKDNGSDPCALAGTGGMGRGALLMKGGNNAAGFNYAFSGITVIKASGKFYPGDMVRGVRGFWLGAQTAKPDNKLLNNQTTDRVSVQLSPTGTIIFRSVVGGLTNTASGADGSIQFAPGDSVEMELTINSVAKTATVKVIGAGQGNVRIRTLKWTSDKVPEWSAVMINQTGNGQLLLDSVEAGTEPLILG